MNKSSEDLCQPVRQKAGFCQRRDLLGTMRHLCPSGVVTQQTLRLALVAKLVMGHRTTWKGVVETPEYSQQTKPDGLKRIILIESQNTEENRILVKVPARYYNYMGRSALKAGSMEKFRLADARVAKGIRVCNCGPVGHERRLKRQLRIFLL